MDLYAMARFILDFIDDVMGDVREYQARKITFADLVMVEGFFATTPHSDERVWRSILIDWSCVADDDIVPVADYFTTSEWRNMDHSQRNRAIQLVRKGLLSRLWG